MSIFSINPNAHHVVIDAGGEDVVVTNQQGIIVQASQKSGSKYGLSPEELLGKSVYDLEEQKIFSPAITPVVLKEKKKVVMIQETPSGSKELIFGFPLFDDSGNVEYVISYSADWSELIIIQDYLDELETKVAKMEEELFMLRKEQATFGDLVLASRSTMEAFSVIQEVARLDVAVLLYGEHGTGKATFARAIHEQSERREQPFITFDCRTVPESLFELELIGDGAHKVGLFSVADGGTLYLDGVDRLPLHQQAMLAKWLEKGSYSHSDGFEEQFSIRLIASSEEELVDCVKEGTFSRDLFYQLHLVPVELRPLMERREDLAAHIQQLTTSFSAKYKKNRKLSQPLFELLMNLPWPGNLDELKNVVERIVVSSQQEELTVEDLPMEYRVAAKDTLTDIGMDGRTLPMILDSVEKRVLKLAKQRYKTTTEMAKQLGISQPSIVRKLKKYEQD